MTFAPFVCLFFTEEDLLDSDDDESKDVNNDVPDKSKSSKNSSAMCSIAQNRPVQSSSIRSQKLVSDYFRKN